MGLLGFDKMGPWSYLGVNVHYSSRKGKADAKADSEIIRAAICTTRLGRASSSLVSKSGAASPVSAAQEAPAPYLTGGDLPRLRW